MGDMHSTVPPLTLRWPALRICCEKFWLITVASRLNRSGALMLLSGSSPGTGGSKAVSLTVRKSNWLASRLSKNTDPFNWMEHDHRDTVLVWIHV